MATDVVLPFVFEHLPVRGALVQLRTVWQQLKQHHDYAPAVETVVGEAAAASLLIAQSLKSDSTVSLQISGRGPLSMLVMQASSALELRGLASCTATSATSFSQLVAGGHCAITVDNKQSEQPYQGIVDVSGASLSRCLETYYHRSAQIPSHLALMANSQVCAGLLLQQMPGRGQAVDDDWRRLGLLAATLGPADYERGIGSALVGRLFAEDDVRVFRSRAAEFRCRCSRQRAANVLRLLGADECEQACAEQGCVVVTCEYCGARETFDAVDIAELFAEAAAPHSDSLH